MGNEILKQWNTNEGYKATVVKTLTGHNCGYVGLQKDHILYGKEYNKHHDCLIKLMNKVKRRIVGKRGIIPLFCYDGKSASMDVTFNVQGSVTFSETTNKYPIRTRSKLHWIGFDCAHSGDDPLIQDLKYCEKECNSLSKQLKEVEDLQ